MRKQHENNTILVLKIVLDVFGLRWSECFGSLPEKPINPCLNPLTLQARGKSSCTS